MSQRRGRGGHRTAGHFTGGATARGDRQRSDSGGPSSPAGSDPTRRDSAGRDPARRDPAGQRARLREIVESVVTAGGYDVEGLSVSRAGRRHLVRLVIDGDGGVSLDAVAEISRRVSAALDLAEEHGGELFAGEYELQVSSPGVDRPLTLPRHWRRNIGRLVQVRTPVGQLTGRVVAADDAEVVLDVEGQRHALGYAELGSGKVQVEFARLAAMSETELEDLLEPTDDETEDNVNAEDDEQEDGE